MKNALLLPLRYLLRLILCIAFTLLVLYCAQLARGASAIQAFGASLRETISFFPFLALLGIFLVSFIPLRRPGNIALSFLFLFIVSASLLSFVSPGLDALALREGKAVASPPEKPRTGIIVKESETVSWYALGLSTDGKALQGLVKADFDSLGDTLSYKPRAGFPEPRLDARPALPGIVDSILKDAAALSAFIRRSGAASRTVAGFAVAFFFCTLWFFPRVGSWPLFGALLALLAFRAALLFAALSASSAFASVIANYFPAVVGAWLPHACMAGLGVLLLAVDLLALAARGKLPGRAA